jgi:hypothetical protein
LVNHSDGGETKIVEVDEVGVGKIWKVHTKLEKIKGDGRKSQCKNVGTNQRK